MPAEEGGYVALNPETGTTTQGETVEEAIVNLTEATALYLSEFPMQASGHSLITMFSKQIEQIEQIGSDSNFFSLHERANRVRLEFLFTS
ncbi:MAG: hypothetical protein ACYCSZ_02840 [Burkholderiales bacterium]